MLVDHKKAVLKDNSPVILRSPSPEDAEPLLAHLKVLFRESYRNMNDGPDLFDKFPLERERQILSEVGAAPDKFFMAAFAGEEVVGNLAVLGGGPAHLRHSAVLSMGLRSGWQGRGLGTEMIRYALSCAKKAGLHRVELKVRTYNSAGIALYEKVGFEKVGLLKDSAFVDGKFCDEYFYQIIL